MVINSANINKWAKACLLKLLHEKRPQNIALEIKFMDWDKHTEEVTHNWFNGFLTTWYYFFLWLLKTFKLSGFSIFGIWVYPMMVISATRHVSWYLYIKYVKQLYVRQFVLGFFQYVDV
jgi:hypothetical protein